MDRADLEPGFKVAILKEYLHSRSAIGFRDRDGKWAENILDWHRNSLAAAERFFIRNPNISVGHLARVLERWIGVHFRQFEASSDLGPKLPEQLSLSNLFVHLHDIIAKSDFKEELWPRLINRSDTAPAFKPISSGLSFFCPRQYRTLTLMRTPSRVSTWRRFWFDVFMLCIGVDGCV